jgi:hypothetical protein
MNLMNDNGNYTKAVIDDGSIWEGEIRWNDWVEKYKPINNHITKYPNKDTGYDMFETYGAEQDYVYSLDEKLVWTEVQGDMSMLLLAGRHFVNRLCYYVCEIPWETGDEQVLVSVEVECDCFDQDKYDEGEDAGNPECPECEGYGLKTEYVD